MAFDAGTIIAHLDIDPTKADQKLADFERKIDQAGKDRRIRISAVFDDASLPKAKRAFADLDSQISRDAMSRLKSSPQGSVLGALNMLFSPHQIAGAPTAQQSLSQGALGRLTGASSDSSTGVANQNVRQRLIQGLGGLSTATQNVRQRIVGQLGNPAAVTEDVRQQLVGKVAGPGAVTEDVKPKLDPADAQKLTSDMGAAGDKSGRSFSLRFGAHIGPLFASISKSFGGGAGGGSGAGGLAGGILGGIGPGILGLSGKLTGIVGGVGSALATLPALAGVAGAGVGVALIGGIAGVVAKGALGAVKPALTAFQQLQNAAPGTPAYTQALQAYKQQMGQLTPVQQGLVKSIEGLQSAWQGFIASNTAGISKILSVGIGLLPGIFAGMTKVFQAAVPQIAKILPLVGEVIHQLLGLAAAAMPAFAPLVGGLLRLVSDILPGIQVVIRAITPFLGQFAQILGQLGKHLAEFFSDAAPAIGASMTVLGALLNLVGGLLPVIMDLATAFARVLGPVFTQLASTISALLPALRPLLMVIVALAAAVLADLGSAFTALLILVKDMAPSIAILAGALSKMFTILENSGVMAVLGDALENIAPLLARLVNLIVAGLVPILPVLITLMGDFSTILVTLLSAGLTTVLSLITTLIAHMPFLVPIIAAVTAAWLAWNLVMAANPIGLIIIAIVGLVGAITLLATHWHEVWTNISNWTVDAWHFMYNDVLSPLINWFTQSLPHAFDVAWNRVTGWWDDVTGAFRTGWDWIYNNVIAPWETVLTQTIPNAFHTAVTDVGRWWNDIENTVEAPVKFVVDHVIDGLISAFDWITSHIGLGNPIGQIHPGGLAGGGKIRVGSTATADDVLARVSRGETVVSAAHSQILAPLFGMLGIPGYARGGVPTVDSHNTPHTGSGSGVIGNVISKGGDLLKITAALATGNAVALENAIEAMFGGTATKATAELGKILVAIPKTLVGDAVHWLIDHFVGSGNGAAIVKDALSWLHKIPYVWGGTSLTTGADCSGFTQAIYARHGIVAPRTSEAQGAWARKGPPIPGGLAFYHSPAGGPDPGHVAIVQNAGAVISQGGGMGPIIMGLHAMPLLYTGAPPGGLGGAGPGPALLGGTVQTWIRAAMGDTFAPADWLSPLSILVQKESGGNPGAIDPIPVNGEHAEGLWQMLPSTYAAYATLAGGIFNPVAEGVAAIRYIMARYGSPFNIPGLLSGHYGGYDSGGWMVGPPNFTGQPEAVLTPTQSAAFVNLASGAGDHVQLLEEICDRLVDVVDAINRSGPSTGRALGRTLAGAAHAAVNDALY